MMSELLLFFLGCLAIPFVGLIVLALLNRASQRYGSAVTAGNNTGTSKNALLNAANQHPLTTLLTVGALIGGVIIAVWLIDDPLSVLYNQQTLSVFLVLLGLAIIFFSVTSKEKKMMGIIIGGLLILLAPAVATVSLKVKTEIETWSTAPKVPRLKSTPLNGSVDMTAPNRLRWVTVPLCNHSNPRASISEAVVINGPFKPMWGADVLRLYYDTIGNKLFRADNPQPSSVVQYCTTNRLLAGKQMELKWRTN